MRFWQGLIHQLSKGALGHQQAGFNILLLTTTGRRSVNARTHALLYLKVGETWAVVASNAGNPKHPDWYFNILSQPQAKAQVGKLTYQVQARTVSDPERSALWQQLLKLWPAYANYQAGIQREIPIVVPQPVKETRHKAGNVFLIRNGFHTDVVKSPSANNLTKRNTMFIPIHRKTFWQDVAVIQAGFALFGLSIAAMIRSNLGTSSWAVLEVALSQIMHLTPGTLSIIVGFTVLLAAVALQEKIGWGTLSNIIFIGLWEDFFLWLIPSVKDSPVIQFGILFGAILAMGIASAIYIGVDAGAGPRDSLMLAVKRKTGLSIRVARACIELGVVLVGWLLGGPLGVGTLIIAILIGPAVQWGFKLFNVQPHKNLAEATVLVE